jgi:hypothetical protein
MGKWAYSLVEFDLLYEPLKAVKGLVMADFIVDHDMKIDDMCLVSVRPWMLFFDGSVRLQGCGIGCEIRSDGGAVHKMVVRLEFKWTNNQAEYEGLLTRLETMIDMGVKDVEAFGDSQLVVQQMRGES